MVSLKTQILLVSDNRILSEGLRAVLSSSEEFEVRVCHPVSGAPLQNVSAGSGDIVLLDVAHGSTFEILERARGNLAGATLLLWGSGLSPEFLSQAFHLGVRGALPESLPVAEFVAALAAVREGKLWFPSDVMCGMLSARRTHLTRREGQLAQLLAQGRKNKDIAHILCLSEGTVKVYLSRLFRKLGVEDRFQLALYALRNVVSGEMAMPEPSAKADPNCARPLCTLWESQPSPGSPTRLDAPATRVTVRVPVGNR